MADTPLSITLMSTLMARLQAMTIAGGYHFNMPSASVFDAFYNLSDSVPMPAVFVVLTDEQASAEDGAVDSMRTTLPIGIVYLREEASDQNNQMLRMKADIVKAVGTEIDIADADSVNGRVHVQKIGAELGLSEADQSVVYVAVDYDFSYEHKWGDEARWR